MCVVQCVCVPTQKVRKSSDGFSLHGAANVNKQTRDTMNCYIKEEKKATRFKESRGGRKGGDERKTLARNDWKYYKRGDPRRDERASALTMPRGHLISGRNLSYIIVTINVKRESTCVYIYTILNIYVCMYV